MFPCGLILHNNLLINYPNHYRHSRNTLRLLNHYRAVAQRVLLKVQFFVIDTIDRDNVFVNRDLSTVHPVNLRDNEEIKEYVAHS